MSANLRRFHYFVVCVVLGACSSDPGPVDVGNPQVNFEPAPGLVRLEAYESVTFGATASDGSTLSPDWSVDGVAQGASPSFQYLGATAGTYALHASVRWSGVDFSADWSIEVAATSSSVTPPANSVNAVPGEFPGSVHLTWERPPSGQVEVPVRGFELYISTSTFGEADLEEMTPLYKPLDAQRIQQKHLFEGLQERELYFVAVRVVDVLDRRSVLSAVDSSESTGHFDLVGTTVRLAPVASALKGPGVLVQLGSYKAVSQVDGSFALLGLPDLLRASLVVAEESGLGYYELHSLDDWPAQSASIEAVLFVRDVVFIDDGNPSGGFPEQLSILEFLRFMSHNANRPSGLPQTIYRWDAYPVQVHAMQYSYGSADYRLAFERGIAAWNEATGDHVLELVDGPVSVGVDYDVYDSGQMGLNSGETIQIAPAGGQLFLSIPERMHIRLLNDLPSQARADLIVLHELGHVLMLNHSPSRDHVMVASVANLTELDRDEAFMARLISRLPQGFDLRWYRDPSNKTAVRLPIGPSGGWCGTGPVVFDRSGW